LRIVAPLVKPEKADTVCAVPRVDPAAAECRVLTYKEGLLSPVAHDLDLRVGRFTVDLAERLDAVEGRFDARSLEVVTAMRDGRPSGALSARDKRTIERTIVDEVLEARRFPEIVFRSTAVALKGDEATVDGQLTLHGRTRALRLRARKGGGWWTVEVRLHQPDFGITPYRAFLGTLRIQPEVAVRLRIKQP
jgi:polyisoprenoid-binding protein YceI